MNVYIAAAALATTVIALAGCATPYSEVPLATNFPTTKQEKVQAAAHWNVIAKDVARQITQRLPDQKPLYVVQKEGPTTFERAFSSLLISALVANGHTVTKQPSGASIIETDTQVVSFSANRPQYRNAGTATALAAGIWALHLGEATAGAVLSSAIVAGDAYSWFRAEFASGETPQTEIIVTTSVSDGTRYLSRNTSIYYVADTDRELYQRSGLVTQKIKVGGGE